MVTETLTNESTLPDLGGGRPPIGRSMKLGGESRKEATKWRLLTPKSTINIGTWNIRTMNTSEKANNIASEMRAYNLRILGLAETRWTQSGETKLTTGEMILHSGHPEEGAHHTEGVALMLSKEAQKSLLGWEPVNSRIMTAKFSTSNRRIALSIIQCYAPTNDSDDTIKEAFNQRLDAVIKKQSVKDVTILMGDFNAKVGAGNEGYDQVMGKCGLGKRNENGELFASCCAEHNLVIGGTIFPHKPKHQATWVSPDMRTENQIDHVCIAKKFRRSLQDVRVRRGADAATDHHLVVAKLKLKLKRIKIQTTTTGPRFNVMLLSDRTKQLEYQVELRNRYSALEELGEEDTVERRWQQTKEIWQGACKSAIGVKNRTHKEWITATTLQKIEERKRKKETLNDSRTRSAKQKAQREYSIANREVKNSVKKDKRLYIEQLATEAEEASQKNNMKALYDTTRILAGKNKKPSRPIKNTKGEVLSTKEEQLQRWAEHFKNLLNQPPPTNRAVIPPATEELPINCNRPSKAEITKAIKGLKSNKAPGPDNIPAEALKADTVTSTNMLHELIGKIWEQEQIPSDWKEGHIVKLPKKGDLSKCDNYRGISLLSTPGKVLNKVILNRLKHTVDAKLRDQQAGFRAERSCTDQIATLRIILEQSQEFQSPLIVTFVDYAKAFDSLDREVLWQLLSHYGIPQKFINIIRNTYTGMTSRVIHEGQLSDSFSITTGVRQGCLMSPFLFLLAVDWIMRQTTEGRNNGIQWTPFTQLDDLDFADDISALSHTNSQTQKKITLLDQTSEQTGLRINTNKTKVLTANTTLERPVTVKDQELEVVKVFVYLGSLVDGSGGTERDIAARIGKARTAFVMLEKIWRESKITVKTKLRIFNTNVKTVLLYGSETWKTTKYLLRKLQVFVNKCLRRILNIRWPDTISNEDLLKKTTQTPIELEIRKRKWTWLGHTLRKPRQNITRQALHWNPQGKRERGRPKNTWRRDTTAEIERQGYSWSDVEKKAQDRSGWRAFVGGLCSRAEPKA